MTTTIARTRSLVGAAALAGLAATTLGLGASSASAAPSGTSGVALPAPATHHALRSGGDDDGGHHGDDDDDHGGSGGGDDDRVELRGSCGGRTSWKLKVKTDDGRLEVEGEVDSNVSGQRWRWTLRHNGSVSDRGTGTTTGTSGSFEVERRMVDLAGTDTVSFRAARRGQVCRGVVDY